MSTSNSPGFSALDSLMGSAASAGAGSPGFHTSAQDIADFGAMMSDLSAMQPYHGPSALNEMAVDAQDFLAANLGPQGVGDPGQMSLTQQFHYYAEMEKRFFAGMTFIHLTEGVSQGGRKAIDQVLQKQG